MFYKLYLLVDRWMERRHRVKQSGIALSRVYYQSVSLLADILYMVENLIDLYVCVL